MTAVTRLRFRVTHATPPGSMLASLRHGAGDPTTRFAADGFWRTTRVSSGTATVHLREVEGGFEASAWGDGAEEALAIVPQWLGSADSAAHEFSTDHPRVSQWLERFGTPSIGRTRDVMPAIFAAVCEQKVTGAEAKRAWRMLVEQWGEPAPGPADLLVAPPSGVLADVPYHALHVIGLEKKRADTIRRAAALVGHLDSIVELPIEEARRRLVAVRGIGVWTTNEVMLVALGDPDAVSVGDYHLKNDVAWALAGRERGSDAEMLELLEPFSGHRARVIRLIEQAGLRAPRRGPRLPRRDIHRH